MDKHFFVLNSIQIYFIAHTLVFERVLLKTQFYFIQLEMLMNCVLLFYVQLRVRSLVADKGGIIQSVLPSYKTGNTYNKTIWTVESGNPLLEEGKNEIGQY